MRLCRQRDRSVPATTRQSTVTDVRLDLLAEHDPGRRHTEIDGQAVQVLVRRHAVFEPRIDVLRAVPLLLAESRHVGPVVPPVPDFLHPTADPLSDPWERHREITPLDT